MDDAGLIALDWGSSSLRAYLMVPGADGQGQVLERRGDPTAGASRLHEPAAFEGVLRALAGDWLARRGSRGQPLPVLACGMVGSAHGWREMPYVACPATAAALAAATGAVEGTQGLRVHIVPGVSQTGDAPDVMRGEETQAIGWLARSAAATGPAMLVLPGTHAKWLALQDGVLTGFATRMTGELFELLRKHSVLGRLMPAEPGAFDAEAFEAGVRAALAGAGVDLGRLLFSVRAMGLFGRLAPAAQPDYLSGLLIGCEVAAGLTGLGAGTPLVLVGEPALCERYRLALALAGRSAATAEPELAAHGLWQLARQAGWLPGCLAD